MKKQIFISPGDKFNKLTAVEYSHTGKHHRRYFKFLCDCGNETTISAEAATSGNTKSCGCYRKEAARKRHGFKPGQAVMRQIISGNKHRCRKIGRIWALSDDEFHEISQSNCHYCGVKPSMTRSDYRGASDGDYTYNGIDRIDSSKGYIVENVVSCCKRCNIAKNDMTVLQFYEWVKRISAMVNQWGVSK